METIQSIKKTLRVSAFVLLILVFSGTTRGQTASPPPPPGSGTETSSSQTGGSAPIGGGTWVLLGLAIAYGGRKVFIMKHKEQGETITN